MSPTRKVTAKAAEPVEVTDGLEGVVQSFEAEPAQSKTGKLTNVKAGFDPEPLAENDVAAWASTLDDGDFANFDALRNKWNYTPVPTVCALVEFFGIDPNTIPTNNAFFSNGYVTFRERNGTDEMTTTGYKQSTPKLHPWPEGLTYQLAESALRRDAWGI